MDDQTTVSELKALVAGFVAEREWEKYHTPKNVAASISVEAAELLEIFQWMDDEACQSARSSPDLLVRVGEEVSDVLFYCLDLCTLLGLDLSTVARRKMEMNRRKYPPEVFRGRYDPSLRKEDP